MVVGLPGISWSPKKGVVGHLVRPSFAGLCILAQLNRPIVFWPKPTGISNIQCILSCYTWCLVFFLLFLGHKFWHSRVVDAFLEFSRVWFTWMQLWIESSCQLHSLKRTKIAPENSPSQKERIVFQPSIFRCEDVRFRGFNCSSNGTYKKIETIVVVSQNGDVSSFRNIRGMVY